MRDKKLRAELDDEALCKKRRGVDMTKKLKIRMAALDAAESLADFWPPKQKPERVHEMTGDRAGTFSIDVVQPYRLLFRPIESLAAVPYTDEQERWKAIKSIEILGIEDTHG